MKRKLYLILFIILMTGISLYSLKGMFSPYVPLEKVPSTTERIQVLGKLDSDRPVKQMNDKLSFYIKDNTNISLAVIFKGQQPANFKHSRQVVLIGRYNSKKKIFYAREILTKCPAKYNETE